MNALHQDLSNLTSGEVLTDPVSREVYATAACIYRVVPRAVVLPRRADEVAAVIDYAAERGIPVTARGAGSAVAGQTVGAGIIIDLGRHLNKILAINYETREAIVEPGLILAELNRELARFGLIFPPDPSSGDYATIGGMIANNSSGAHSLKYGDTRKWTRRLKTALSDGAIVWLDPKPALPERLSDSDVLENRIYSRLPRLLSEYEAEIERSRPRVAKNSSGYHVWDLVSGREVNPAPLVVGSEGTLAVVVKAALGLAELPPARAAALLCFDSLRAAADAVGPLAELGPAALEIMDELFISTVREHREDLRPLFPESAKAALLIEFEAEELGEAVEHIRRSGEVCRKLAGSGFEMVEARGESEIAKLFEARKAASPILYRMPGRRLTRFVEDVVIPPDKIGEGIETIREILAKHGTEAPILGHAGSGNLHLNPRLNLEDPEDLARMKAIADELYPAVIEMGGSISGEHGDGILRAPYLKKQFPKLIPLFKRIKDLFDPKGIMNPGKILTEADSIPTEPLRIVPLQEAAGESSLHDPELVEMLLRCHGCGLCRTFCPVAKATGEEIGLPRGKTSALRAIAFGELSIDTREVRQCLVRLFSMCTLCQRCVTGCPTGIEPFRLVRAAMADIYKKEGRPLRERYFGLAGAMLRASRRAPGAARSIAHGGLSRRALEIGLGVSRKPPLPSPQGDALERIERSNASSAPLGPAVLYLGCMSRYADEEGTASAALEVLTRLGYEVVTPDLPCCGETKLATADLAGATREARALSKLLREYAENDTPIITTCPACALMIRHEHPRLVGEGAEIVAANTLEIFELVARRIGDLGLESGAKPVGLGKAILHRGCHEAALGIRSHGADALSKLPGLELVTVDDACCGLAGVHGMRVENAEISKQLSRSLTEAAKDAGTTTVIAACPACRLQIKALGLEPVSPIVLLRDALIKIENHKGTKTQR